jgi:UDP-galactopyranose mutase
MKSYEELPQYLHFFDIAMMPFALNNSTKFISPTKTLEYMAAMKPIISTKIKDVVRDYISCVSLIDNADDFSKAIAQPMTDFQTQYQQILENTSWDRTACKMATIINKVSA